MKPSEIEEMWGEDLIKREVLTNMKTLDQLKQNKLDEFHQKFPSVESYSQRYGDYTEAPLPKLKPFLSQAMDDIQNATIEAGKEKITENTSDGYHTFKELYEFRLLYNAALFNELAKQGLYNVHKSKKHSDGEYCFGGGWFIVTADIPTGQISNHYELKDWDLFECEERELADKWDGHTPRDVAKRLRDFLSQSHSVINNLKTK